MKLHHRKALLEVLSRLDRIETNANAILAAPGDTGNVPLAEELRELIVQIVEVEEKLESGAEAR
jgi:hypothetical protein